VLDPLNAYTQEASGNFYGTAGRYRDSIQARARAIAIDPQSAAGNPDKGIEYLQLGDLDAALKSCSTPPVQQPNHQFCLAIIYDKLNRRPEAEAALAWALAEGGDAFAYQYVEIYAQWGNILKALDWLETAYRLRDAGLVYLKTDTLMDPLRQEPRFQAIYAKLKFP
jgi:tetratricopeptide (TPR) repeat protein